MTLTLIRWPLPCWHHREGSSDASHAHNVAVADPRGRRLRRIRHHPRQHCRQRRPALDPARPPPGDLGPQLDRQRLCARLRRPASHRWAPRRLVGTAPRVPDRARAVHRDVGDGWAGPERRHADRRTRSARSRRSAHDAADARDHQRRFPDERERATAVGIWAAVGALGFALGPLIGGVITETLHWSWIFFVNVPVGIIGLALGMRLIPESKDPDAAGSVDWVGLSVISAALFSLTYALIKANDYGWGSPIILALLAVAVGGLGAFVWIERRAEVPMVDLSLFRIGAFSGANVVIMVVNLATFGVLLYLSLYLQNVVHYSP